VAHRQRMSIQEVDPSVRSPILGLNKYVRNGSLDQHLLALVDIRASQLNGCAWCLDMHVVEAREAGAPQRQVDLVAAWWEADGLFSEREQAALAFTEQVTRIGEHGVTDEVWARVRGAFSEQETLELLMAIIAINVWNRVNVTFRTALPSPAVEDPAPSDGGDAVVDVRAEPPARRHELIFATYRALGAGTAFVLVNDHDPKPLFYQFEAEHAGEFTWDYLEEGPDVWRVRIGRS